VSAMDGSAIGWEGEGCAAGAECARCQPEEGVRGEQKGTYRMMRCQVARTGK